MTDPEVQEPQATSDHVISEQTTGHEKEPKRTVHVGNLASSVSPLELFNLFGDSGEIEKVNLICKGGEPTGYAQITFKGIEAITKAVETLNKVTLKETEIEVEPAKGGRGAGSSRGRGGRTRGAGRGRGRGKPRPQRDLSKLTDEDYSQTGLYCSNLPFKTTDEELATLFADFSLSSARVVQRRLGQRMRCFGFVELSNPEDQSTAIESVNGKTLKERPITVKVAIVDKRGTAVGAAESGEQDGSVEDNEEEGGAQDGQED